MNHQLTKSNLKESLPDIPPKRYFGSSTDHAFVEDRRQKLESYLQQLILMQSVWTLPVLVTFLDSPTNTLMYLWNFEKMRKMQKVECCVILSDLWLTHVTADDDSDEYSEQRRGRGAHCGASSSQGSGLRAMLVTLFILSLIVVVIV